MLTEDTWAISILPNGEVTEVGVDPNIKMPELCKMDFTYCPYCEVKLK